MAEYDANALATKSRAERLEPGERLWNGRVVTPHLAGAYNRASERIESFERAGRPAPDNLLNARHNLIAGPNY